MGKRMKGMVSGKSARWLAAAWSWLGHTALGMFLGLGMGQSTLEARALEASWSAQSAAIEASAASLERKSGTMLPSHRDPSFHPSGRVPVLNAGSADAPATLVPESYPGLLFDIGADASPVAGTVLPDGRVLIASGAPGTQVRLRMFNADGSTDSTWGDSGTLALNQLGSVTLARPQRLTPLSDGSVLVSLSHAGLARFWFFKLQPNGQVDTDFGLSGLASTATNGGILTQVRPVVDSLGRILVAASVNVPIPFAGSREEFAICRFLADGQLDLSFSPDSNDGTTNDDDKDGCFFHNQGAVSNNPSVRTVNGLAVDSQDRPYLAAMQLAADSFAFQGLALLRFTADGRLDSDFPELAPNHPNLSTFPELPGRVVLGGAAAGGPIGMAQRPDGRLLIGMSQNGTAISRMAQFLPDGRLDFGFAVDGVVEEPQDLPPGGALGIGINGGGDLQLDSAGRAIVMNRFKEVSRFLPDGLLDTGFGAVIASATSGTPFNLSTAAHLSIGPQDQIYSVDFGVAASSTFGTGVVALKGGDSLDVSPDPFALTDQANVPLSSQRTSNSITLSGLPDGVPALVRVLNGTYSIGCSNAFTANMGVVRNGDTLCVRHTAAATEGTATISTLIVGSNQDNHTETFVSTTSRAANTAPVANADNSDAAEDSTQQIDVLANDTDADGDLLFVDSFTQGAHGAVTQPGGPEAVLVYTPVPDYSGSDSFDYTVADGFGGRDSATVLIGVNPVNDAPVANPDTVAVDEDASVIIDVLANDTDADGDSLTIDSFTQGAHGTVESLAPLAGLRYTPDSNFFGEDSFSYVVSDGVQDVQKVFVQGSVTISVNPINDDPLAVADTAYVGAAGGSIAVLANDSDVEGDPLQVIATTQGANGSVSIAPAADAVIYTPNPGFSGVDGFSYTISDGQGGLAAAQVTVAISTPLPPLSPRIPMAPDPRFAPLSAEPGFLVSSMGSQTRVADVLALSDGRFLLAGDQTPAGTSNTVPALLMLLPNGSVDTSFANNGLFNQDVIGTVNVPGFLRVLQTSDGGFIALSGEANGGSPALHLIKFTATGAIDTSFGSSGRSGIVAADLPGGSTFLIPNALPGLAIDASGRYLFASSYTRSDPVLGFRGVWVVCRFLSNGTPDSTYGAVNGNGCKVGPLNTVDDSFPSVTGLVTDGDAAIFTGDALMDGQSGRMGVVRLDGTGQLDAGFASGGIFKRAAGTLPGLSGSTDNLSQGLAIAIRPDRRLVVAFGASSGAGLLQLLPDGTPDPDFGQGDGITSRAQHNDREHVAPTTGQPAVASDIRDMALEPSGHIVVLSRISTLQTTPGFTGAQIGRYLPDGLQDTGFGEISTFVRGTENGITGNPSGLDIGPNGAIVVAGGKGGVITNPAAAWVALLQGGPSLDTAIDPLSLSPRFSVSANSLQTSEILTISGLPTGVPALVRVENGSYALGCGTGFVSGIGLVRNGDTLCVRHTAAANGEQRTRLIVSAGLDAVEVEFVTDTRPEGGIPTPTPTTAPTPTAEPTPPPVCTVPGALDASFAPGDVDGVGPRAQQLDGARMIDFGTGEGAPTALATLPDDRVLLLSGGVNWNLAQFTADGELDPSFGGGDGRQDFAGIGTVNDLYANGQMALLRQPDGRWLLAGQGTAGPATGIVVARLLPNGSVDASFGNNGSSFLPHSVLGTTFRSTPTSLALQVDGRILVAGLDETNSNSAISDLFVYRLNADGSPDDGAFADNTPGDGFAVVDGGVFQPNRELGARNVVVRMQGNQPVVFVTSSGFVGSSFVAGIYVYRFQTDGSLDATFGTSGERVIPLANTNGPLDVVVLPDQKLLFTSNSAALGRLNADGSIDTGFGGDADGLVRRSFQLGGDIGANELTLGLRDLNGEGILLQPDGQIVVHGIGAFQGPLQVARFFADGTPDLGFGDDLVKISTVPLGHRNNFPALASAIDSQGRILLVGQDADIGNGSEGGPRNSDHVLVRLCGGASLSTRADAVAFAPRFSVAPNSTQASESVSISGLPGGIFALVGIHNGSYAINGGSFTTEMGKVRNGDTLRLRHVAAASGEQRTSLFLGGGPDQLVAQFITDTRAEGTTPTPTALPSPTVEPSPTAEPTPTLAPATPSPSPTPTPLPSPTAAPNQAPIAVDDFYDVVEGGFIDIDPVANDLDPDGDALSLNSRTTPQNGGFESLAPLPSFRYVPGNKFRGLDAFSYDVIDTFGAKATGRVQIRVLPASPPPELAACTVPGTPHPNFGDGALLQPGFQLLAGPVGTGDLILEAGDLLIDMGLIPSDVNLATGGGFSTISNMGMVRFDRIGQVVESGQRIFPRSDFEAVDSDAVLVDSEQLVVGYVGKSLTSASPKSVRIGLHRVRADGTLRTDFGRDVSSPYNTITNLLNGIAAAGAPTVQAPVDLEKDGQGGYWLATRVRYANDTSFNGIVLLHFNADGFLDDGGPQDSTPLTIFGAQGERARPGVVFVADPGASGALAIRRQGEKVLLMQPSGAGHRIRRFGPDGRLDASFGNAGVVELGAELHPVTASGFSVAANQFFDLRVQPDGRILVTSPGLVLARLLADGQLDPGFGTNGVLARNAGGAVLPQLTAELADTLRFRGAQLALQPDGRILLLSLPPFVDIRRQPEENLLLRFARFLSDGTPDLSLGGAIVSVGPQRNDGVALPAFGLSGFQFAYSNPRITLAENGDVLLAATFEDNYHPLDTGVYPNAFDSIVGRVCMGDRPQTAADPVSFTTLFGVPPQVNRQSESVTISGLPEGQPTLVRVLGGSYSKGCVSNAFTERAETVVNGDTLCVRHRTAAAGEQRTTLILGHGALERRADFVSDTRAAPTPTPSPTPSNTPTPTPTAVPNLSPQAGEDVLNLVSGARMVSINLLANDSDPDGDALSVTAVGRTPLGSFYPQPGQLGVFAFDPKPGLQLGSGSVSYTLRDARGAATSGLIRISIQAPGSEPRALGDAYRVAAGVPTVLNVLANDVGGGSLQIIDVSNLGDGEVRIVRDGKALEFTGARHGRRVLEYFTDEGGSALVDLRVSQQVLRFLNSDIRSVDEGGSRDALICVRLEGDASGEEVRLIADRSIKFFDGDLRPQATPGLRLQEDAEPYCLRATLGLGSHAGPANLFLQPEENDFPLERAVWSGQSQREAQIVDDGLGSIGRTIRPVQDLSFAEFLPEGDQFNDPRAFVKLRLPRPAGDVGKAASLSVQTAQTSVEALPGASALARAGVEYAPFRRELEWQAGDALPKTVLIPVLVHETDVPRVLPLVIGQAITLPDGASRPVDGQWGHLLVEFPVVGQNPAEARDDAFVVGMDSLVRLDVLANDGQGDNLRLVDLGVDRPDQLTPTGDAVLVDTRSLRGELRFEYRTRNLDSAQVRLDVRRTALRFASTRLLLNPDVSDTDGVFCIIADGDIPAGYRLRSRNGITVVNGSRRTQNIDGFVSVAFTPGEAVNCVSLGFSSKTQSMMELELWDGDSDILFDTATLTQTAALFPYTMDGGTEDGPRVLEAQRFEPTEGGPRSDPDFPSEFGVALRIPRPQLEVGKAVVMELRTAALAQSVQPLFFPSPTRNQPSPLTLPAARVGEDYEPQRLSVQWAANETEPKTVYLPLLSDVADVDRILALTLTDVFADPGRDGEAPVDALRSILLVRIPAAPPTPTPGPSPTRLPTPTPTATLAPNPTVTATPTPSATPIPAPPTVRILPEQPRAIAEGQSLSYLLQLSAPSAQAVAVRLALTGGLDASDVQFSPPTVVFSPGELQKTVQVLALFSPENEGTESGQIILLADNAVAENAVTLLISEAGGAVASPTPRPSPTASPTPGPTPALPVAVISGPERVQRTAELLFDASSSVPVRGRFLAQYRWTLRKADDGTELDRQLSGSPIFRVRAEQLGKLLLELQVVDIGSFVSEPRQLQIEVVPEEDSLRLFFENGVATAREGGEIRLRVERIVPSAGNSAPPIPLSARLLRLGGTAGAEEIQIDGAELRWEANDRSPRTVFVRPLVDAEVEPTETLSLGLEEVVGVRSSSPKQLLAQIGDNSPRSTVQLGSTLVNLARPQGQGATLLLPVQRTGSLEQALDVRIGFAPSAVAECVEATGGNSRSTPNGLDFDNRDTLLRLPARVASALLRVSVLPGDRSFAQPNAPCEGFAVRLLDDAAYDLGAGQQAQINLRDGEVVIRPLETDILVKEDAGRAILRLEALANQSFTGDVRLRSISSEKDSAKPGLDFVPLDERLGLSAGALPFRAETKTSLKLIDNAVADGTRSLLLTVDEPQFAPLDASIDSPRDNSNPLRVTIIDDEEAVEIIPPKPGVPKLILTGGKLKAPLLQKAGEDGRVELLIEPIQERADAAVLLQIDLATEPQAAAYALCDAQACVENNTAYIDPDSRLLHILLSDGGAGDLDGEVNGEIRHLGQLLQISAEGLVEPLPLVGSAEPSPSPAPSAPPSRRQGSGGMGLGWLLLLLLWRGYGHSGCVTILRAVRRRRWRPNAPCSKVSAIRRSSS